MRFRYHEELPITSHREQIINAVKENDVIVVVGETGSGKSTQLPKMILEALAIGEKTDSEFAGFKVVSTQPRRLAATSISAWIAEDMGVQLGKEVGYKIRFDDESSLGTLITICTDGILLQEMKGDSLLSRYDAVLIDEAHERNLNIDFLLGLIKDIYQKRLENNLKPLKIMITSATVDASKFANFFAKLNSGKEVPVINVSGRLYPVDIVYEGKYMADNLYKKIAKIIQEISKSPKRGDALIFMPGESEIFSTIRAIEFLNLPKVKCLPLYSRLTMDEQQQIFAECDGMKVVVATNIAETSLTVPGIKYVIDSGLSKMKDFNFRTGIGSLDIKEISQASAVQRAGRAGRIAPGVCIRMYSHEDFLSREKYAMPEIQRSDLASVVLHMILIGINDVYHFNFIDPPERIAFESAFNALHDFGALDSQNNLTELGRKMAHLPLEPRISAMLLAAEKYDCVRQVAVIASCLSVKDFFVRPNGEEEAADAAKQYFQKMTGRINRKFKKITIRKGRRLVHKKIYLEDRSNAENYVSDLLTYLHVWNKVREIDDLFEREAYCKRYYLNFEIVEEVEQIFHQLIDTLKTFAGEEFSKFITEDESLVLPIEDEDVILKAITAGLLQNVCEQSGPLVYRSGKSDGIMIHPGSALFNLRPQWFISAEIVETSRLYARNNTVINPMWLEEVAPYLCVYQHSDIYYDRRGGQMVYDEDVFFKGHRIIRRKAASIREKERYNAFEQFVREGLVKKLLRREFVFIDENDKTKIELQKFAAMTGNKKLDLTGQRLFDWYILRFTALKEFPVSEQELRTLVKNVGEEKLKLKVEDFISENEMKIIEDSFPSKVFINGIEHEVRYYFEHLIYPDGPVISLRFDELEKLEQQVIEKLSNKNKVFRPYLLICSGQDFEQPVAESYNVDELKHAYDHWFLKKNWKKARLEVEKKSLRADEILAYYKQLLQKIQIGFSMFKRDQRIFAYSGIRSDGGKRYSYVLFGSEDDAIASSASALRSIFIDKYRYDLSFSESQKNILLKKKLVPEEVVLEIINKLNVEKLLEEFLKAENGNMVELFEKKLKDFNRLKINYLN